MYIDGILVEVLGTFIEQSQFTNESVSKKNRALAHVRFCYLKGIKNVF